MQGYLEGPYAAGKKKVPLRTREKERAAREVTTMPSNRLKKRRFPGSREEAIGRKERRGMGKLGGVPREKKLTGGVIGGASWPLGEVRRIGTGSPP